MNFDYELSTDLYELTMAQGYLESGMTENQACFYMYFRDNPFKGGYAVACGMDQVAEMIENFHFTDEDIDYLSKVTSPAGDPLFHKDFLDWLADFKLDVDIDAVHEGTIVFPNDPLVRVTGSLMQAQILETALLNIINFETLIATKAARVCVAAKTPVAEFGLRRAQGVAGGLWASRASIVGGCTSTSNVLAGQRYHVPVSGTHAHSWVMSFDDELTAFRTYAKIFPTNCVLLIDTYDVKKGLENAIIVGHEMEARGQHLSGVRIDSGDLAWLAKYCRERLDEAGLKDCGIVLSNDLDEYSIKQIVDDGAKVTGWGVGTKLASAYDQPSLGGVYKMSAIRANANEPWQDRIKVTELASKLTFPGVLDARRYYLENGKIAGDMVFDTNSDINAEERIIDPSDGLRQKVLGGLSYTTLLHPLARKGNVCLPSEYRDTLAAQKRVKDGLERLDESQKRMLNPHSYPVGLEAGLFHRRQSLAAKMRGLG